MLVFLFLIVLHRYVSIRFVIAGTFYELRYFVTNILVFSNSKEPLISSLVANKLRRYEGCLCYLKTLVSVDQGG